MGAITELAGNETLAGLSFGARASGNRQPPFAINVRNFRTHRGFPMLKR